MWHLFFGTIMFLLLEVQITIIQKETDERSLLIIAII